MMKIIKLSQIWIETFLLVNKVDIKNILKKNLRFI
jgi:hypothetical protein